MSGSIVTVISTYSCCCSIRKMQTPTLGSLGYRGAEANPSDLIMKLGLCRR